MAGRNGNGPVKYDVPGILSVLLIPGSDKADWEGIGDAVLVDGQRRIVAVADGPARNPEASSAFLKRFRAGMADLMKPGKAWSFLDSGFTDLVSATNLLVRETTYHDGTTFSAVVLGEGNRYAVLHAGDSLIFLLTPSTGEVAQISRTNHCLVGRTASLFQAEEASFREEDLFLIASDGLASLARSSGRTTAAFIGGLMRECGTPVDMMESICESARRIDRGLDDIGVVVVKPERLSGAVREIAAPSFFP
ncbi:MAG: SpoIIE family protein phosphatase [Syntrophaceae bacterium]|nr:SpoIIE family protein phosphatase [Syntrophaceae bacterium]